MSTAFFSKEIAEIYDDDMGGNIGTADIPMYLKLAQKYSGPILELGCGTGRVMEPLINAGYEVWGIDNSLAMLRKCEERLEGEVCHIVHRDMRNLHHPSFSSEKFELCIIPYSSFTYLLHTGDQTDCLTTIRRYLAEGGALVIDVFVPKRQKYGQWDKDYLRSINGELVRRSKMVFPSPLLQVNTVIYKYERIVDSHPVPVVIEESFHCHYVREFSVGDIKTLISRDPSYKILEVYGDYDFTPITDMRHPETAVFEIVATEQNLRGEL